MAGKKGDLLHKQLSFLCRLPGDSLCFVAPLWLLRLTTHQRQKAETFLTSCSTYCCNHSVKISRLTVISRSCGSWNWRDFLFFKLAICQQRYRVQTQKLRSKKGRRSFYRLAFRTHFLVGQHNFCPKMGFPKLFVMFSYVESEEVFVLQICIFHISQPKTG